MYKRQAVVYEGQRGLDTSGEIGLIAYMTVPNTKNSYIMAENGLDPSEETGLIPYLTAPYTKTGMCRLKNALTRPKRPVSAHI